MKIQWCAARAVGSCFLRHPLCCIPRDWLVSLEGADEGYECVWYPWTIAHAVGPILMYTYSACHILIVLCHHLISEIQTDAMRSAISFPSRQHHCVR